LKVSSKQIQALNISMADQELDYFLLKRLRKKSEAMLCVIPKLTLGHRLSFTCHVLDLSLMRRQTQEKTKKRVDI